MSILGLLGGVGVMMGSREGMERWWGETLEESKQMAVVMYFRTGNFRGVLMIPMTT